jgi:ATP-dependent exoDNAse (exonuclease V) alpha subunit
MALFSWSMQIIKRSAGRSVVAAAAYRAGERLHNERQNLTHDYRNWGGVEHSELLFPENAPDWTKGISREGLWNTVEHGEKRKDAQTARELRIMIPRELDPETRITLVRDYLIRSFVSKGMVADVCWHNTTASDGREQPHAHVLLTMRPLAAEGFGLKSRHDWVPDPTGRTHEDGRPVMVVSNKDSWNSTDYFEKCREDWEVIANTALEKSGSAERIDRRSLLERGLSRLPEPALRLAWYLKDLYGSMKERFGHYQMARHYRAVEKAAQSAFRKLGADPPAGGAATPTQTTERYFAWFDRQLARLEPAPSASRAPSEREAVRYPQQSQPPPTPDMER